MTEHVNTPLEGLIEQGFEHLREGQFDDAVEAFSAAHTIDGREPRALHGRGLALTQLGQTKEAESDLRAALDLNGDDAEAWLGLALCLAMQNKIYESIGVYDRLIKIQPTAVTPYLHLARLQLKVGAIAKGRELLTTALTLRPTLSQRRTIEAMLKEQKLLDQNRYYRPDFENLRRQRGGGFLDGVRRTWAALFKKKVERSLGSGGADAGSAASEEIGWTIKTR